MKQLNDGKFKDDEKDDNDDDLLQDISIGGLITMETSLCLFNAAATLFRNLRHCLWPEDWRLFAVYRRFAILLLPICPSKEESFVSFDNRFIFFVEKKILLRLWPHLCYSKQYHWVPNYWIASSKRNKVYTESLEWFYELYNCAFQGVCYDDTSLHVIYIYISQI